MTQGKWEKIIGILLGAILAVLAVLGWVISPGLEQPEARLRERISIDARDDAYLYDGADLYVYSDGHSTQKFHVDGATGNLDGEGTLNVAGASTLTGNVDMVGTLQYGADDLYPVGFASSGQQAVYGTDAITGTATAAHGLTTVTFALCALGEDPTSGAGDGAMCTVAVSGNVATLKIWQDDFITAATETDVVVQWIVVGAP
jgi:hypothetical protein